MEFWGKLFWLLLYPSNMMYSMHCMMLFVMMFPQNRWCMVKICTCHQWVSIRGNTLKVDVDSFDPHSTHIELCPDCSGNSYDCWNICCGWIDHLYHWYTKSRLYQMPQTEYWNSDFRSWIYIKPSNNLYYFNFLFIGYSKALLMVTSSI